MWYKKKIIFSMFLGLMGCSQLSNEHPAPVVELGKGSHHKIHIVKQGETLNQIAWQYKCHYRELAEWNQIKPPYVIYPGQKLSLKGAQPSTAKIKPKIEKPPITKLVNSKPQTIDNNPKKYPLPKETQDHRWVWPAQGKIVKSYSIQGADPNKGIDIEGQLGTPVKAASNGKVVYSGAGLRGYGQLIIIKHDDIYLSAYAYNRQLFVKEGDTIQKGQIIAEMGHSEANKVSLHFEIRKNGQPINPLMLLPA